MENQSGFLNSKARKKGLILNEWNFYVIGKCYRNGHFVRDLKKARESFMGFLQQLKIMLLFFSPKAMVLLFYGLVLLNQDQLELGNLLAKICR